MLCELASDYSVVVCLVQEYGACEYACRLGSSSTHRHIVITAWIMLKCVTMTIAADYTIWNKRLRSSKTDKALQWSSKKLPGTTYAT